NFMISAPAAFPFWHPACVFLLVTQQPAKEARMANTNADRSDRKSTQTQSSNAPARRSSAPPLQRTTVSSPFGSLFQRWNDEMDRMFEHFGFGGNALARGQDIGAWAPEVEMFQRGNDLVVRADLPGLSKDDVQVDIADDVLTIQGERKHE